MLREKILKDMLPVAVSAIITSALMTVYALCVNIL